MSRQLYINSIIFFLLVFPVVTNQVYAQTDSLEQLRKERKVRTSFILGTTGAAYLGTMAILSTYWYGDQARSEFQWFNDNLEWGQVDKLGHAWAGYHIARSSAALYRWAHYDRKKAAIYGAVTSFVLMAPIEILDGYSEGYGASPGDLVANTLGIGLFLAQDFLWKEERIKFKFSFHRTEFAQSRPELLGSSWSEELVKDYNGQTYWLSVDLYSFLGKRHGFLKFINPGFGYGAENMLYGSPQENEQFTGVSHTRQFYFSIDPSLSHIKSKSKLVNSLIFLIDAIKIPSPTLEFSNNGVEFHPLYF